jgi:hypothetical protein
LAAAHRTAADRTGWRDTGLPTGSSATCAVPSTRIERWLYPDQLRLSRHLTTGTHRRTWSARSLSASASPGTTAASTSRGAHGCPASRGRPAPRPTADISASASSSETRDLERHLGCADTSSASREPLKIVVSPVRVRVSPSWNREDTAVFCFAVCVAHASDWATAWATRADGCPGSSAERR